MDEAPGASRLAEWFGSQPTFHDAEVISLELHRAGPSTLRVHTWETTDRVDSRGRFLTARHAVVSSVFEGVTDIHLDGFNGQNVIARLSWRSVPGGWQVTLEGCYGVAGTIDAAALRLELEPGILLGSSYHEAPEKEKGTEPEGPVP